MEDNGQESNKDNSCPAYVMVAISKMEVELSSQDSSIDLGMPTHRRWVVHSEDFLFHAIYWMSHTLFDTQEEDEEWFNETRYMFCNCGMTNSRTVSTMYHSETSVQGRLINKLFITHGYKPMCMGDFWTII